MTLAAAACGPDLSQVQKACPAGYVPRIVDVKQGATGVQKDSVYAACPNWIKSAEDGLIDDFEDDNTQMVKLDGRSGYWFTHTDPNGSTIEPETLTPEEGGASGKGHAVHIIGETASSQGAYGSTLGLNFKGSGTYDASKYVGIRFKAKIKEGTSRAVRFKIPDVNTHKDAGVCTDCWNHFGKDLTLSTEWEEYVVLFDDVHQNPGWGSPRPQHVAKDKLWGIDWTINPGRKFDLWIDDVEFITCQ
jgi:endoglucanase